MYIRQGLEANFTVKTRKKRLRSAPNVPTKPRKGGEQCVHGRRANSRMLQRRVRKPSWIGIRAEVGHWVTFERETA